MTAEMQERAAVLTLHPSDTPDAIAARRRALDEELAYSWPPWRLRGCGTEAAYRRHLRRGEKADRACLDAAAAARRRYGRAS